MTLPTKQICQRLGRALALHPIAWLLVGGTLFWVWGGLIPRIRWNAIEIMMAKNLLAGNGLVVAPLDPPALWRPLLGALVCALVELFTTSPRLVYQIGSGWPRICWPEMAWSWRLWTLRRFGVRCSGHWCARLSSCSPPAPAWSI